MFVPSHETTETKREMHTTQHLCADLDIKSVVELLVPLCGARGSLDRAPRYLTASRIARQVRERIFRKQNSANLSFVG